jgi:uncharacterized protein (TIGR01244 family)
MNYTKEITPSITIADQPTESDLTQLSRDGFKGIVNLRNDGEPEQSLSTADEGNRVAALGMGYLHYGVGGKPLSDDGVTSVCDFIDNHTADGGKVLVHCRRGGRAAALVALQQARQHGWGSDEVRAKAAELGLPLEGNLMLMVEDYLRRQTKPM